MWETPASARRPPAAASRDLEHRSLLPRPMPRLLEVELLESGGEQASLRAAYARGGVEESMR